MTQPNNSEELGVGHTNEDLDPTIRNQPMSFDPNLDGGNTQDKDMYTDVMIAEEHLTPESNMASTLKWHHRYNHIPFVRLQMLAKQGAIPDNLADCKISICSSCVY